MAWLEQPFTQEDWENNKNFSDRGDNNDIDSLFLKQEEVLRLNKKEEAIDTIRELQNDFAQWNEVDWDYVHELEDKFWISWDAIRDEYDQELPRNDNWIEKDENDISRLTESSINSFYESGNTPELSGKIQQLKSFIFDKWGYYHLWNYFEEWVIEEDTIHFYPNSFGESFWDEPIRVTPETTLQEIGTQMLRWLIDGWKYTEWQESNWDLVSQIENTYWVNWDTIKED